MPSPRKTFADYIAIAICPLVIMILVGSLSYFLLDIGYEGRHEGRLRWALFWFVLAIVLVSRISIEQSAEKAGAYGLLLALATAFMIWRLTGVTLVAWLLLGFIWWCTSKLTWDCTLIEDTDDASGEGLLQAGGLEKQTEPPPVDAKGRKRRRIYWWQRLFLSHENTTGQPHSPGLWIVYFSLVALPAFGFGQLLIRNAEQRGYGFKLLWLYVAAAMGLLMLTSFLGLRRYLRQRFLKMPATISLTWVIMGTCLIAAILVACLLIPRPNASYSITTLVEQAAEAAKKQASKYAAGGESGEGEGRRIGTGEGEGKGEEKEKSKAKGETPGEEGESTKKTSEKGEKGKGGEQKSDSKKGEPSADGEKQSEQQDKKGKGEQPSLTPENKTNWVATLIKFLIYGLIIAALLYLAYRFRRQIAEFLRALWAEIVNFFRSLFHREPKPEEPKLAADFQARIVRRAFSSFRNPFRTGEADALPPAELVMQSFEALQAWAAEHGTPRNPDETPLEFSQHVALSSPELAEEARELARLYTRFAYAEREPTRDDLPPVERLWEKMSAARVEQIMSSASLSKLQDTL